MIVLSGIQPSGQLHIGNYIGALSGWVQQQGEHRNFLFIADLHAATIPEELPGSDIRQASREAAALYLASGLDPQQSVIFLQSDVAEHPYLGWLITCMSPLGWLDRMTQFKSKSARREVIGAGLYTYPCLQAADILLYDADYVPVGDDQRQHVEFARDVAQRFNAMFGECFKIPQPLIRAAGARIMGLDNPEEKMSKSVGTKQTGHAVFMRDDPDTVRRKFQRAKTDSGGPITFAEASPGVRNLLAIYEVLSGEARAMIERRFAGRGYKALKDAAAEAVIAAMAPIQARYRQLMEDRGYLDSVLRLGAEQAQAVAQKTLERARRAMKI